MRSDEDRKALDEAIIAVDAAINTLVLARITLERRIQTTPMPEPAEDGECPHAKTFPIETNGGSFLMCQDCGNQLDA